MKIVLITGGTRGDVQPFVALALGLRKAGHEVRLATHEDFRSLAEDHELPFSPICGSFFELLQSDLGRAWLESAGSFSRYKAAFADLFGPVLHDWVRDQVAAVGDAEAIITHPMVVAPMHAAEKNDIPLVVASLVPFVPTGEFNVFTPDLFFLRGFGNRALWKKQYRVGWEITGATHNILRQQMGLSPIFDSGWEEQQRRRYPILHLYSRHLVPHPRDFPDFVRTTGFCHLPSKASAPPARLLDFLDSGPPPLYLGFGSMTGYDPERLLELSVDAVRTQKQRAVFVSGWGGASIEADDVLCLPEVDHDFLFPRVRAALHHGGAGTLAASLRAGKPTAVVPFFGDQPFWGYRAYKAGVAPRPLPKSKLTRQSMSGVIAELLGSEKLHARSEILGQELSREDGVRAAVRAVEEALTARHR